MGWAIAALALIIILTVAWVLFIIAAIKCNDGELIGHAALFLVLDILVIAMVLGTGVLSPYF